MLDVVIDELVFDEDFKRIDRQGRQKIIKAIRKKLTVDPESHGKPLRGDLKRFWKLRVGEYRLVYSINKAGLKCMW